MTKGSSAKLVIVKGNFCLVETVSGTFVEKHSGK